MHQSRESLCPAVLWSLCQPEGTEGSGPPRSVTPRETPHRSSLSRPQLCLGHHCWVSPREKLISPRCRKRDQAEVVQDAVYWVSGHWIPPTYLLSLRPLPTLPFLQSPTLLPHVFKSSEDQKKRRKKKHVGNGKEADGLARGKRTASLSRPQAGLPSLCASA